MLTTPALLQTMRNGDLPTELAVKTWRNMYQRGHAQNPPIAAATTTCFLYCAWAVRGGTSLAPLTPRNAPVLYCAAAALTLAIVPYTLAAMMPTNSALIAKADAKELGAQESSEAVPLLQKWTSLDYVLSHTISIEWDILAEGIHHLERTTAHTPSRRL
ncbi:conserved hypothetical protein [Aspergillus terreus NIH2624]|uniref:Uncharacterized protein n=1 Tax=Aspergillus terreus (strain NIH 2624 / FGSC A1156) TaxID=341663 RepID=Q0CM12_ASPTN|nr:uncharacterized protein ATEG_05272 [Aspergillus terreus NIH2624]EAU34341.1 conserved hypothetical protein [Aspergillus terreus NIH2624]